MLHVQSGHRFDCLGVLLRPGRCTPTGAHHDGVGFLERFPGFLRLIAVLLGPFVGAVHLLTHERGLGFLRVELVAQTLNLGRDVNDRSRNV